MASSSPTGMILLIDVDWQKSCTTFRCIRNLVNHLRFFMVLHTNWCTAFCLPTVWDKSSLDIPTQTLDAGERAVPQRSGAPNKHEKDRRPPLRFPKNGAVDGSSNNQKIPGDSSRDLESSPIGGHQQPLKGSFFHHPKEVTSRIAWYTFITDSYI